jgi:hypothetical protein
LPSSTAVRLQVAEEEPAAVTGETTPVDPTTGPANLAKAGDAHGFADHAIPPSEDDPPQHTVDGDVLPPATELAGAEAGSTTTIQSSADPLPVVGDGLLGIPQDVVDPLLLPASADILAQPVVTDIDQLVTPLVTTLFDTFQAVGSIVGPLAPGVDTLLQSVVTGVDQTVADAVQALDALVDPIVAPLTGPVAALEQPFAQVGQLIATLANGDAAHDVVASAGSLVFQAAPLTGSLAIDDLFTGGRYTDYGLALGATSPDAGVTAAVGATSTAGDTIDHVLAGAHDGSSADDICHDGQVANVTLPSALDELHLRGLGDGIV